MSYVRVETSFWSHRKTLRLRGKLGNDAYWLPLRLWSYAAEHQQDGNFSDYNAAELALLLAYQGDAKVMLEAMQQAGWMDGMKIHDWEDYNGCHAFFRERAKTAAQERWRVYKEKKQKKEEKIRRKQYSTVQYPSNANSIAGDKSIVSGDLEKSENGKTTQKNRPENREMVLAFVREIGLPESDGHYCFDKWEGNGFTNGGKPMKDWKATIRSWQHAGYLPSQRKGFASSSFQKNLSFEERRKRKEEIQNQLNAQFKSHQRSGEAFSEKEQQEREQLRKEMESL